MASGPRGMILVLGQIPDWPNQFTKQEKQCIASGRKPSIYGQSVKSMSSKAMQQRQVNDKWEYAVGLGV